MFLSFINELKEQLSGKLPGQVVQFEMAGSDRRINPPDLDKIIDYKESAVCILLYLKDNRVCFPLIERVGNQGVHSGQLALPGGKVDESDKTSSDTAIRELKEEIGFGIEGIQIIGKLTDIYIPPSNFLVRPYVGFTSEIPEFNINKSEVENLIIVQLNELLNDSITKITEIETPKGKINAPYFDIEGKILWGATAMILNELKRILKSNTLISSFQSL